MDKQNKHSLTGPHCGLTGSHCGLTGSHCEPTGSHLGLMASTPGPQRAGRGRSLRVLGWLLAAALVAPALGGAEAYAQDDAAQQQTKKKKQSRRTGPYLGVAPGTNDELPRLRRRARKSQPSQVATWVGFQWVGEGGRVFIQTTGTPQYVLVPGQPDEIVIDLPDTKLRTRNDQRPLDTSWFPTAVASVKARQFDRETTRVTIKLREVVGYDLRQEGNYLMLEFRPLSAPPVR